MVVIMGDTSVTWRIVYSHETESSHKYNVLRIFLDSIDGDMVLQGVSLTEAMKFYKENVQEGDVYEEQDKEGKIAWRDFWKKS